MDSDKLLQQLDLLSEYYTWSIEELDKITKQYTQIEENLEFDLHKEDKLQALTNQFIELDKRHRANENLFRKLLHQSRQYFLDKYNLDILKLIENRL